MKFPNCNCISMFLFLGVVLYQFFELSITIPLIFLLNENISSTENMCYVRKIFLHKKSFQFQYIHSNAMSNFSYLFLFDLDVKVAPQRKIYVEKFSRNSTHFSFFVCYPQRLKIGVKITSSETIDIYIL